MRLPHRAALALTTLGLLAGMQGAHAQSYAPGQPIQDGWFADPTETRANGRVDLVPTPSNDGDGSLRLRVLTQGSTGKTQIDRFSNVTLTDLNASQSLGFDNYVATGAAGEMPAFRLYLSNGTALVWEGAYNGVTPTLGSWQTFNIAGGKFWQNANSTNYNNAGQEQTLAQWLNPTYNPNGAASSDAGTTVQAYSLGVGSGVPIYDGNVDHVLFDGHTTNFQDVQATPEPSSVAAFGALGLMLRARKRKASGTA